MNDMQEGVIPGMEIPNGQKPKGYPQKFEYSPISPNHHGRTNEAAKHVDAGKIIGMFCGK